MGNRCRTRAGEQRYPGISPEEAKITRKSYHDPFAQMQDLCGLRVIVFYAADLDRVDALVRKEFVVQEAVSKSDIMEPDRFGYRSNHYVVSIQPAWLHAPQYRGLEDLCAEIQVRTVLMHAWADLSHKLSYKTTDQIPSQFRRQVFQLSALFELADQEFERLRNQKAEYQKTLIASSGAVPGDFDVSQPFNVDSLQAFLDRFFPNRARDTADTAHLFEELSEQTVTFSDLVSGIEATERILPEDERESFQDEPGKGWTQAGAVRHILDLTHSKYWRVREHVVPQHVAQRVLKLRRHLASERGSV